MFIRPNSFYYEDGKNNIFDELGNAVYDPMEKVMTQIDDPNIVLETLTSQTIILKINQLRRLPTEEGRFLPAGKASSGWVYLRFVWRKSEVEFH